ncbi:MAG: winged helix DNA-binding domain-containing protein, partial [Actinomycetota bacterium]|nr:winged helix DNA-binding domain-containing protein [Actinomycetota bacterium]
GLAPPRTGDAGSVLEAVRGHLAMQAQDLASGVWSVGVRTGARLTDVNAAIEQRLVTRTWPMRGTLHLMATEDVRWMCRLLNARAAGATRARFAQLEITDAVLDAARDVVVTALSGGAALSRPAVMDLLRDHGIRPDGQRGLHLVMRYCQEGLLCQGPPEGAQPTFVLVDDWVPRSWDPGREEAMATLAERYVRSHGPVTERDLAGWCGQGLGFVREAVSLAGDRLGSQTVGGLEYLVHAEAPEPATRPRMLLLPGFDEYVLGYKDRSAVLTAEQERLVVPGGNGVFLSTVLVGGQVVGTWRRRVRPRRVDLTVTPFAEGPPLSKAALQRAAAPYGRFLGLPAFVSLAA